jgi:hypothetical protein
MNPALIAEETTYTLEELTASIGTIEELEATKQKLQDKMDNLSKVLNKYKDDVAKGMSDLKTESISLTNGKTYAIKKDVRVSISQERMGIICDLMTKYGYGSKVKPKELSVTAEEIPNLPEEFRNRVTFTVPHASAEAAVRRIAQEGEIPEEIRENFKVFIQTSLTVKQTK